MNNPDQTELFAAPGPVAGRHVAMLETAIAAAEADGRLEAMDMGLVSLARANAFALDAAELSPKPYYPLAQLTPAYREVLEELTLTPKHRESAANDSLALALEQLAAPAVREIQ